MNELSGTVSSKVCKTCGKTKSLTEFERYRNYRRGACSACRYAAKRVLPGTPERWRSAQKKSYLTRPDRETEAQRHLRLEDHAKCERIRRQKPEHKERERVRGRRRQANKTPEQRLRDSVSSSIHQSLKKRKGGRSWELLVGYTIADLVKHLEGLFQDGMTWANYGFYGWHVDHRIPRMLFDHNDPTQLRECWSLTNLQPLWALDNLKKGATLDKPPNVC